MFFNAAASPSRKNGQRKPARTKLKPLTKEEQKTAAAVYLHQADSGGEWGEIRFDFENGTAEIIKPADWDTMKSNIFAKAAIRFVRSLPEARLPKETIVPFEI